MKLTTRCPHCHRDLAVNQRGKHCGSPTCTWLKCSCRALVHPKAGTHTHPEDTGHPDTWPCNQRSTP